MSFWTSQVANFSKTMESALDLLDLFKVLECQVVLCSTSSRFQDNRQLLKQVWAFGSRSAPLAMKPLDWLFLRALKNLHPGWACDSDLRSFCTCFHKRPSKNNFKKILTCSSSCHGNAWPPDVQKRLCCSCGKHWKPQKAMLLSTGDGSWYCFFYLHSFSYTPYRWHCMFCRIRLTTLLQYKSGMASAQKRNQSKLEALQVQQCSAIHACASLLFWIFHPSSGQYQSDAFQGKKGQHYLKVEFWRAPE